MKTHLVHTLSTAEPFGAEGGPSSALQQAKVSAIAIHPITLETWSFLYVFYLVTQSKGDGSSCAHQREDGSHVRFNADGQRLPIKVSGLTNVGFVTCFDIWRDAVVAGTSQGKLALINKNNKVEKVIDAHSGAVLGVKWAGDGTLIMSRIFPYFLFHLRLSHA